MELFALPIGLTRILRGFFRNEVCFKQYAVRLAFGKRDGEWELHEASLNSQESKQPSDYLIHTPIES